VLLLKQPKACVVYAHYVCVAYTRMYMDYIHTYTHMRTNIHTYICVHTYMHTYAYIHTCIHIRTIYASNIHIHTCAYNKPMYKKINFVCMYKKINKFVCTCIYVQGSLLPYICITHTLLYVNLLHINIYPQGGRDTVSSGFQHIYTPYICIAHTLLHVFMHYAHTSTCICITCTHIYTGGT